MNSLQSVASTVAAIQQLDLEPIKRKLMDPEEGQGWSSQYADRMETAYKRFLTLLVMHPNRTIAPTKDIDKFWHGHILDTMKYARDCQAVFGHFLHHYPYFGLRGEQDAADLKQASRALFELFDSEFADSPASASRQAAKGDAAYCMASAEPKQDAAYCMASAEPKQDAAAYCMASAEPKQDAAYCMASAEPKQDAAYCMASAEPKQDAAYCMASAEPKQDAAYCMASAEPKQDAAAYCMASAEPKQDAAYCMASAEPKQDVSYCMATVQS